MQEFLKQLDMINIAVVTPEGRPWVVPVAVQKYKNGSVEWFSKKNTVHSKAIAQNPEVALSAFAPPKSEFGMLGFYAYAQVEVILSLPGAARYRATITEAWRNDASQKKKKLDLKTL